MTVYKAHVAPVRKQGEVTAPDFENRRTFVIVADSSTIATRKMVDWYKQFQPDVVGVEVVSFELAITDADDQTTILR